MVAPEEVEDVVVLVDPTAIRAIAHPARLLVIEALYDHGRELTATQAAALAGISPSAMSYHLRALERYGIVRRGSSSDARERPWIRAARDLRIRPSAAGSRAAVLATSAVLSTALDATRQRLLAAVERSALNGESKQPLDDAINYMHTTLLVTADEAKALVEQIDALVEPWRLERRTGAPPDAGRLSLLVASAPEEEPGATAPPEKRS